MTGERILLLFYLGINGVQDIRKHEIFFGSTLLYLGFSLVVLRLEGTAGIEIWWNCLPGVLILSMALLSGGKIGGGDALAILVTGLWMGLYQTIYIMVGMLFLIFLSVLIYRGWTKLVKKRVAIVKEIPMIPFMFCQVLLWSLIW